VPITGITGQTSARVTWCATLRGATRRVSCSSMKLQNSESVPPGDIEPNIQFALDQYAESAGGRVTFSKEARALFLDYALSS
jgi:sigma54-dependent transcription regulator